MEIDKIVEDAVKEYCNSKGYSEKLTKKMLAVTKKLRTGQVSDIELDNFLEQIQEHLSEGD
jgi:hypothetical protein